MKNVVGINTTHSICNYSKVLVIKISTQDLSDESRSPLENYNISFTNASL